MIDTTLMMVTYNRLELTKRTLENLDTGREYNIVIVDNGSTDGTVEFLKSNFENTILLKENKGIAVGRNIALREADKLGTKWYCTIDNDVEMPSGWLQECVDILQANKGYGAIGVNMENTPYPIVKSNGYRFQDKSRGNLGTACMVFPKQIHQMLGFFTTEYGKYGEEDADFGMRVRVAGFKLGYIERMGVHLGDNEVGEYREFKTKQHSDNLALFKQNCARYFQRAKALYISYKDE